MEAGEVILRSSDLNSMESATLGRVMSTLLSARSKKLEDAISRFDSASKRGSFVSLEDSLWILHKYLRDAAQMAEPLDQILVPMIEHSLKVKDLKHGNQAMILLNWLFQDELLFQALTANLAGIIERKCDHFIALGWCTLVRDLVEYETSMAKYMKNGIKENYYSLLKLFSPCTAHLVSIVCNTSSLQDGFELPTRLSIAAADCILALTLAFTKKGLIPNSSSSKPKLLSTLPVAAAAFGEKKGKPTSDSSEVSDMEMKLMLWNHLDELIVLVQRLIAWSAKSRWLDAKGLERVIKWLEETKGNYTCVQHEAGSQIKTGVLLLSSCWKHYGMLLHLEDHNFSQHYMEFLDQYLSGIKFYADNYTEEHAENKDSGIETTKFFLNCLSLLLGHCSEKQFENAMSEYGLQMSRILISQFHCADEDVIEAAVCIFKAVIFRSNSSLARSSLTGAMNQLDTVLPLLLNLLDERDGTARAVVILIAEYCSISKDSQCLNGVLKRLASGAVLQRRNAIDVISELFRISPNLMYCNQDIANHLLECLGEEGSAIQAQASKLIPKMDPLLVLPALVHHVYSSDGTVQSSASNTILTVLRLHNRKFEVVNTLLDCLSNLCQDPDIQKNSDYAGAKFDADIVLRLIPEWSRSVDNWNVVIEPLIEKLFAEPSNAIIVRFLSYISENIADAADLVFHQLLLHMKGQRQWESNTLELNDPMRAKNSLFDHLCPLLIIKMLPLRVFDDLNSLVLYGGLGNLGVENDTEYPVIKDAACVAAHLLNRAFDKSEFEDVRKLAAELCGRIHPQVRGKDSIWDPAVLRIIEVIETILSWPSLDGEDVLKAQHGCIDCLALMICAELQAPESFRDPNANRTCLVGKNSCKGDGAVRNSILSYVIYQLTPDENNNVSYTNVGDEDRQPKELKSLSFRLCMANVLISACQKVSNMGKKPLAQKILSHLIYLVGVTRESEIRAACIQVFFSVVYHLKCAVIPYSSDLLKVSMKSLKGGSEQERIAGIKLMASLMASEEAIMESIAGGLLESRAILLSTSSDPSPDVRQLSKQLLTCLTLS